jgi:hypothetical protein
MLIRLLSPTRSMDPLPAEPASHAATLKLLREEGLLREWTIHGYRLDPRVGEVVAGSLRGEEFAR